eukprot:ANDGO_02943.mRNA.1 putative inactive purple acid phosphatase 9
MRCLAVFIVLGTLLPWLVVGQPSVSVDPTVLQWSGSNATVAWKGIGTPSETDCLVFRSPADSLLSLARIPVTECDTWKSGACSMTFSIVNILQPYRFEYSLGCTGSAEDAAAHSLLLSFSNVNEHLAPRVSLDGSDILVVWTSAMSASEGYAPYLQYRQRGCSTCPWTQVDAFLSRTYAREDMCGAPANVTNKGWHFPGYFHAARISEYAGVGLWIEYQLGDHSQGVPSGSPLYELQTPPVSAKDSVLVIAFGDLGVGGYYPANFGPARITSEHILEHVQEYATDEHVMVFHNGDISYAMGWQSLWPLFHDEVSPMASKYPWMMSLGNHEYDWPGLGFRPSWGDYGMDSGGECGVPVRRRFWMPWEHGGDDCWWYSFDYGPIHFSVVSSEHDYTLGSEQNVWLNDDLSKVDRSKTPWVVLASHRPGYTAAQNVSQTEGPVFDHVREALEPVAIKYNVDVVLTAHIHFYERTCPIKYYDCQPAGTAPVYVLAGMAGAPITPPPPSPFPHWEAGQSEVYGFLSVFANYTHMEWTLWDDATNKIADQFGFSTL